MKIDMVPHNPERRWGFQKEAEQITAALGGEVVILHHVGSTAIPGISAKPVIDLLLVVTAQQYSDLKRTPAAKHPNNMEAYMDGKDEFIQKIDQCIQEMDRRTATLPSG